LKRYSGPLSPSRAEATLQFVLEDLDVGVAELVEALARQFDQMFVPLDGVDLAHEVRENRRRISGAGSDLKSAIGGAGLQALDHQCDDIGLRDGLSAFDRKRRIQVCELGQIWRDKELPRNLPHGTEQSRIANSPRRDSDAEPFAIGLYSSRP
jgi:hypothetical protein